MNRRRLLRAIRCRPVVRRVLGPVKRRLLALDRRARTGLVARMQTRAACRVFSWNVARKNGYCAEPIANLLGDTEPRTLNSKAWFRLDARGATRYRLTIETDRELCLAARAGIIEYRFLDWRGSLIESVDVDKDHDARHGYHDYVPRAPRGRASEYIVLSPPKVRAIDFGLAPFGHAEVTLTSVMLEEIGPRTIVPPYDAPAGLAPRTGLRLAVIADIVTTTALRYEAGVAPLSADGWRCELDEFEPDALVIESAWNGNGGEWRGCVANLKDDDRRLRNLVDHARVRGIPVVFWDNEGPEHYDEFIGAARLCEIVCTTDLDAISRYANDLGHERVFAMPFCIQPDVHNPRRSQDDNREERHITATSLGEWSATESQERGSEQESLFAGAEDFGLEIFHRRFARNKHERNRVPARWQRYVHGSLDYAQALSAYRRYAVLLDVQTARVSHTVLSRQALEASACGALVVSGRSADATGCLGEHLNSVADAPGCGDALSQLRQHPDDLARRAHRSYRHAHRHHQWSDRLGLLAEHCNIALPARTTPKVSAVLASTRVDGANRAIDYLASIQDPDIELEIIVLTGFDPDELRAGPSSSATNVRVVRQRPEDTLGATLNRGVAMATGEFVAKIDDDDLYGPNYLQDLLIAIDYSRADITGKQCHYQHFEKGDLTVLRYPGHEHRFTHFVCGPTIFARSSVFELVQFYEGPIGEDTIFLARAVDAGLRIFSADRFNFVYCRRADPSSHTWKIEDDEIISSHLSRLWGRGFPTEDLTA